MNFFSEGPKLEIDSLASPDSPHAEMARLSAEELLPLVYNELRNLARARLSSVSPGQTLQATALVHEAYLKMSGPSQASRWRSPRHFFATAALAMRQIMIDRARSKGCSKRSAKGQRTELSEALEGPIDGLQELLDLDDALTKLEARCPEAAEVARLRLYAGLSLDEAALAMDFSRTSVHRYWTYARAFLKHELS